MVADENFFVTVLKNSPFCGKHVNKNFLHVQFDQWEHEKLGKNNKKCLQPNPKHCGRSPTTLTLEYYFTFAASSFKVEKFHALSQG